MSRPYIPPKPSAYDPNFAPGYRSPGSSTSHGQPLYSVDPRVDQDHHRFAFASPGAPAPPPQRSHLDEAPASTGTGHGLVEQLEYTMDRMVLRGSNHSSYDAPAAQRRDPSSSYGHSPSRTPEFEDSWGQQSYAPTHSRMHSLVDPASSRPTSSSASGIISLYAEETPTTDGSMTIYDDASSSDGPSQSYRFPDRTPSPAVAGFSSGQARRHASRPLPLTPQMAASIPSGPTSPVSGSQSQGPAQSPLSASRLPSNSEATQQSYFNIPSPQPHSTSQPNTPLGQYAQSTNSSYFSSMMQDPSPYRANSSSHSTPTSVQFHRPLPSTSSQLSDPRRSPYSNVTASTNAENIKRNQSFAYGISGASGNGYGDGSGVAPVASADRLASPIASNHSHQSSSGLGRLPPEPPGRTPTDRNNTAHLLHGFYDPNYTDAERKRDLVHSPHSSTDSYQQRQRTQSDAPSLLPASRSRRQPLPPVPHLPVGNGAPRASPATQSTSETQTSTSSPESRLDRGASKRSIEKRPLQESWSFRGMDDWTAGMRSPPPGTIYGHAPTSSSGDDIDLSLLSNLALLLKATVPRGTQIKGSINYPHSFTGKDAVTTLQNLIPEQLAASAAGEPNRASPVQHRQVALLLAKSLKSQLFFHEVDWGENELRDGVEEVYSFLEDSLAAPGNATNLDAEDWSGALGPHKKIDLTIKLPDADQPDRKKRLTIQPSATDLDELPTGVFTPLTRCYSPLCSQPGIPATFTCYSPSCPNSQSSRLNRGASTTSSAFQDKDAGQLGAGAQQGVDQAQKKAWAEMVPPELLQSIPASEVARQNAILETIQKEEEFLCDLELLQSLFVRGLQRPSVEGDPPPLPIGPDRDAFIAEVFGNHLELTSHIRQLVERLHVRQREENPIVQTIGDVFLSAALEWGEAYNTYLANYPLAINRVKREISINPKFKAFVEKCRRHPAAHKHPLENFLFRPPARLQRYHLHLESILKKTEEGNTDRDSLQNAIEIINDQCKTAQAGVEATEVKVKIREYAYNLAAKRNKTAIDMDLLNPQRQLIHQGRVLRKPDAFDFDWTELLAILFDNYFIVTKQKRKDESEDPNAALRFVLAKRPIPIEMLELSGFNDASISRSIGLSNFHISRERDARDFWPFTVSHLGGKLEPLTLFAPSKDARLEWKKKLEEAIGLRTAVQEANKVFEPYTLSDDVFALPSATSPEPDRPVAGADPGAFHGRVTCAVPFTTNDGRRLVAIGCADGVWIGLRHDSRSLRKVLHLKLVTQCAVLESFGIFVVLADKVLISYSLEALVPSANSNTSSLRPPQKLSGNRDVLFFNVGVLKDRTLLVYMKKKANESVFRALEPVLNAPRSSEGKSGSGFFGKFGKDSKSSDWFRIYKTFFIPSEAYSMQFLRSKLCIVCARGFEIMNLDSLLPGTIPDFVHAPRDDPRVLNLQKRVETARPLGMFKTLDGDFLLCYDAFACYVDRLGEPIKLESIIEWEGYPKDVAFSGQYVLAFDSRFVEVRDTQSGQLVQIIRGADIRHVSGSGSISSTAQEASLASALDADANPVIYVKRQRAHGRIPFDFQAVYELAPTAPPIAVSTNTSFVRSNTVLTASSRGSSNAASSGWI